MVVLFEAFGVEPVGLRQVERLAAAGYLALMPDLYSQGGARRCLVSTFRALSPCGPGRAGRTRTSSRRDRRFRGTAGPGWRTVPRNRRARVAKRSRLDARSALGPVTA